MRTKKQVFLVYTTKEALNMAINFLLELNVKFDVMETKLNKYVRISQKSFKKCKYIDLYTNTHTIFSSVI